MQRIIFIFLAVILTLFSSSCRLDVVEPDLIVTETNKPSQDIRLNYLNYEVVAENFNNDTSIPISFNVGRASIYITLLEHNNGHVHIEIRNSNQQTVFRTELHNNLPSYTSSLSEPNLSRLYISHQDFTGKFKIRISAIVQ